MVFEVISMGLLTSYTICLFGFYTRQGNEIEILKNEMVNIKNIHEIELKHIEEINRIKESNRIETGQIAKMQ